MITSRQMEILRLIVDDFINTGLPVGSRTLSKHPRMKFSPATIRNDMADLEEIGFIIQPHISAGRIPSELGLRFYVDTFLSEEIREDQDEGIRSLLSDDQKKEDILERAVRMLTDLTDMTAMITLPAFRRRTLANMKLVYIDDSRFLMVLISDTGETRSVELRNDGSSQKALDELNDKLLANFQNQSIMKMNRMAFHSVKWEHPQLSGVIDYLLPKLRDEFKKLDKDRVFLCGKDHLLQQGDFASVKEAKEVLRFFENAEDIQELLNFEGDETQVLIGSEINNPLLRGFSLIRTHYTFGEEEASLGIIGSIRMNYARNIAVIENLKKTLSNIFCGINL